MPINLRQEFIKLFFLSWPKNEQDLEPERREQFYSESLRFGSQAWRDFFSMDGTQLLGAIDYFSHLSLLGKLKIIRDLRRDGFKALVSYNLY